MIHLTNATKSFCGHVILDGITLTLETGSIVGLAGPSGSGKSTLLRCVQGLESLDTGTRDCPYALAFMFQDFQLFPHMNVLENLTFAPLCLDKKGNPTSKALDLLKILGLEGKANAMPSQLSGGQKQRVALARCLMTKPDYLLCDEPTSGLDVATIDDVVALLKDVQAQGVSMIIASHDLDFLSKICERIIVLKGGKIVFDAPLATLSNPVQDLKKFY